MFKLLSALAIISISISYYFFFSDDTINNSSSVKSFFDPNKKINYLGAGGAGWSNEIAVHPENPNIVFVGADNGGLFKSTNGGETWIRPMGALGSNKIFNFQVCGVVIDQQNPNTVWAATGAGPFKSDDLGETWKYLGGNGFPILNQKNRRETNLSSVYVHPANSNLIYLGLGGSAKHRTIKAGKYFEIGWKSTDGGKTWNALGKGGDLPDFTKPFGVGKIAFSFSDQKIIYFATNQGLFKSNDGGSNWLKILNAGIAKSVDVVKNNPNKIFCAVEVGKEADPNNGIWYSTDAGASWNRPDRIEKVNYTKSYLGNRRCVWTQIADDDGKYIYAASFGRLLQSTDGGLNWDYYSKLNQKPLERNGAFDDGGNGLKQFYIYPKNKNIAYADGTYFTLKTTDHGLTWNQTYGNKLQNGSWSNNGYVNTAVKDGLVDNKTLLFVDPDIGLHISTDKGYSWKVLSEDNYPMGATSVGMDSENYYVLFGSRDKGGLFKASKNNPFDWELLEDLTGRISDYTSMLIAHNNNLKKIFIADGSSIGGLFVSNNFKDFKKINSVRDKRANFIYQDPNNSNNLYTGFSYNEGGGLFRSTNFGESWSRIDNDDNGTDVYSVVVKPGNSNIIIKGVRGYSTPGKGGAYKSTDFGKNWKRVDDTIIIPFESFGKDQQRWVKSLSYTIDGKLVMAYTIDSDAYWFPGIYISGDDGATWEKLNTDGISGRMDKVIPDPTDSNILWICSDGTGGIRYRIK